MIVVGAGLAGLRCAVDLQRAGRSVIVLEAADQVGGRVRTDRVDGFTCDRGFQVLNPAYPAVRRSIDVAGLSLQPFDAGLLARTRSGLRVIADPVRAPRYAADVVRSGLWSLRDLTGLARWLAPALRDPQASLRAPDLTLGAGLDAAGVRGPLRPVLDRFLAGVLADSHQLTSSAFTRMLVRSFVLGRPGLPYGGMAALPRQLAAELHDLRLGTPVRAVHAIGAAGPGGAGEARVETDSGVLAAPHVVVAADPATATGLLALPAVAMKGLTTWWFAAETAPDQRAMVAVDARPGTPDGAPPGPVWNAAVITAAAPGYGDGRRHLIAATTLHDRGPAGEAQVRRHVGEIYGCDTGGWDVVVRHDVPEALPACPPPVRVTSPPDVAPGVWVCGDHRDTASIQGALVSGERAARAVLAAG